MPHQKNLETKIFQIDCPYRNQHRGGNDVFLKFDSKGELAEIRCPEYEPDKNGEYYCNYYGGTRPGCVQTQTEWTKVKK